MKRGIVGREVSDGVKTNFFPLRLSAGELNVFKYDIKFSRMATDWEQTKDLGKKSPVDVGQGRDHNDRKLNNFIQLTP